MQLNWIKVFFKYIFGVSMKKSILSLGLIAIAMLIGLSSCNKSEGINSPQTDRMSANIIADEYIPYFDAAEFTVTGDLTHDIEVYPEFNRDGRDENERENMRNKMRQRLGPGLELREIIGRLNLTEEQREQIAKYIVAYHDCVKSIILVSQEKRREIIEKARTERQTIMEQVRSGEMTREEAARAMKQLNERVQNALNGLVDRAALCDCYKAFLRNIFNVLDEEQKTMFLRWLAGNKNPCLEGFELRGR